MKREAARALAIAALLGASPAGSQQRPMTIDDILALRRPSEVRMSPDGSRVAFIVTRTLVERDTYERSLYVAPTAGSRTPVKLLQARELSQLAWTPDGSALTYVSSEGGSPNVWRIGPIEGKPIRLTTHDTRLGLQAPNPSYAISPDGRYLAITLWDSAASARELAAEGKTGIIFDEWLPHHALTDPLFRPRPAALWIHDLRQRTARKVWESPLPGIAFQPPPQFAWSPDSRSLALLFAVPPDNGPHRLGMITIPGGAFRDLPASLGVSYSLRWAADGRALEFVSEGPIIPGAARWKYRPYRYRLDTQVAEPRDDSVSRIEGDVAIARAIERQSGDTVSGCSADRQRRRVACVREAPMTPPEVVVAELHRDTVTARPVVITRLNERLRALQLGRTSRIDFAVDDTTMGHAGLIEPVGRVPGKRYPLLVMTYGMFNGRTFIGQAAWVSNWPAQVMAARGFAVLLMNLPPPSFIPGHPDASRRAQIDRPIAAIRSAVDTAVARGLADPARLGLLGWSYGSFLASYVMTHEPGWFHVSSSGEHGLSVLTAYALDGRLWRNQEDLFYGGSPYAGGAALARWQATAPVFSAHRVRAPMLFEYSGRNIDGIELYVAIVRQGGQAELVHYPNDMHVLEGPLHRRASMQRNLDWFDFWLLDRVDPDPAKREQYRRWERLRQQRDTRLAAERDAARAPGGVSR